MSCGCSMDSTSLRRSQPPNGWCTSTWCVRGQQTAAGVLVVVGSFVGGASTQQPARHHACYPQRPAPCAPVREAASFAELKQTAMYVSTPSHRSSVLPCWLCVAPPTPRQQLGLWVPFNPMPLIIWVAIIIEIGLQNWPDVGVLLAIQFINATLGW